MQIKYDNLIICFRLIKFDACAVTQAVAQRELIAMPTGPARR